MAPNIDPDGGAEIGSSAALAALADRVAQLERQVAALTLNATPEPPIAARPVQRVDEKSWRPSPLADALMPVIPPRVLTDPPPPPIPGQPEQSLESRLGSQVFNMIGIFAILIGTSWFLKMAIERGWIGPVARVLIGLAAAAGLVLWSENFRRKGLAAFSYSLKAIGSAVLYLTLWAAFHLYHLLPAEVALVAMVLVTAWNGFMAWSQDAELLAAYGLLGGFLTPLLLATGGNHEGFLFTYVGAIDLATILLTRWKPWRRLLLPALAGTVLYLIGWYSEFFHLERSLVWDAQSTETTLFVLMFFAMFALVSLKGFRVPPQESGQVVAPVLIPLANAAWLSLALYSVMQDSGLHTSLAWMMVALAALYLGLMRLQATSVAGAMHLACSVVFLTIAIPLKASGHTMTTAWLVEGLVLYWAATRVEADSGAPAKVLSVLSIGGYALGLMSLAAHWFAFATYRDFFNANLGSAMIAVATLAGLAWLASRSKERNAVSTFLVALIAVDLVALLLVWGEVVGSSFYARHAAFANPEFATALVGLALLAAVAWVAYRVSSSTDESRMSVAGVTLILFNLLTILSIEREIGALWNGSNANLQRSLAISAFLMLYGALLLAAGFWHRSEFVRWQALILLIFTIGKVFFYDISGLSQGYRVASFLALGALLMGISLAYQKDWLGLRAASEDSQAGQP
jgi:uncharacterized membrane protein